MYPALMKGASILQLGFSKEKLSSSAQTANCKHQVRAPWRVYTGLAYKGDQSKEYICHKNKDVNNLHKKRW